MQSTLLTIFLAMFSLLVSCKAVTPDFAERQGDREGADREPTTTESRPVNQPRPNTGNHIKLTFSDEKFKQFDGKTIAYSVEFQGFEDQGKVIFEAGQAVIAVNDVEQSENQQEISIKFLVDEDPLLRAEIDSIQVNSGNNALRIKDCLIRMIVWNGKVSEGNCQWTVKL